MNATDKLCEIYKHCTNINIKPHNPHLPDGSVTVKVSVSIKHASGCYQYAEIYAERKTLNETIEAVHYLVSSYKESVEKMP